MEKGTIKMSSKEEKSEATGKLPVEEKKSVRRSKRTTKGKTKKGASKQAKTSTTVIKQENDDPLPQPTNEEKLDISATIDDDSGFDSTCKVSDNFTMNPVFQSPVLDDKCIITGANASLLYWKKMAEKRAVALEITLHQNEHIRDQITVLEAENSLLKEAVKRAEKLTEITLQAISE